MFCMQKYMRTLTPIIIAVGLLSNDIIVKGCSGSKNWILLEGERTIGYLSRRCFSVGLRLYNVAFT